MTINEQVDRIVSRLILRQKAAIEVLKEMGVIVDDMQRDLDAIEKEYRQLQTPPMVETVYLPNDIEAEYIDDSNGSVVVGDEEVKKDDDQGSISIRRKRRQPSKHIDDSASG